MNTQFKDGILMDGTEKSKIIALLPMKANSTRVPGKNFRPLAGKPLFQWVLNTLISIKEIDRIVINTDAPSRLSELGVCTSDRVLIRDRAKEICGDDISMNRIISDDINFVHGDIYLMTHTTNPFLTKATIRQALSLFEENLIVGNTDSLFTVNKFQTRFYRSDGSPVNHDPNNLVQTQDLEPWFEENSNLYIFTKNGFKATNARIGSNPILFEMSSIESIDIDTEKDWALAEIVSNYFSKCKE